MGEGIERVGFTQFTASDDGYGGVEELSAVERCEAMVADFLRSINTRPGPDEEVLVQVIVRPRRERGLREAISRRIDR